jgi:tetratricopeptide (TPR) repeat protein
MTFLLEILGVLAFRSRSLRALAARRALALPVLCLAIGFLAYVLVRNSVYSTLQSVPYVQAPPSFLDSLLSSNLIQILLFFSLVYVPALIALSNWFAGDGLGFSVSRAEYTAHVSALFPLWGTLFLIAAPIQWIVPQFLVLDVVSISIGLLWLVLSMAAYTLWAIREIDYIPAAAALGVMVLSWLTLPVFYMLATFLLALPFFLLLPFVYVFALRLRELLAVKGSLRDFQQHLHSLTLNPRDADAHYQLGLLHLQRAHLDAAQGYFEQALAIDPRDPDYHYFMGRVFEARGEWPRAMEEYEATYRLNPAYRLGDIFREVGKGYLHTDKLDKAIEFLKFFLERRSSDPEGRYWLAVALRRSGKLDEMRVQLSAILEQARTSPRFFRRENREWIYRARMLLRGQT